MNSGALKTFLAQNEVQKLVQSLAHQINEDYKQVSTDENPLVIAITLKGALFFGADLIRELTIPVYVETIRVASYGASTQSSGKINLVKDLETDIKDKNILILDEIADTGRTLKFLTELFAAKSAKSVKVCALLSKPSRREVEVKLDYCGREVDDFFLVGYGLDFNEKYRQLKDISILFNA